MDSSVGRTGCVPEAEEHSAGIGAQLVIWDYVCKLPAYIAYMSQDGVAFLPLAHEDGIGVDLQTGGCEKRHAHGWQQVTVSVPQPVQYSWTRTNDATCTHLRVENMEDSTGRG